MKSDYFHLDCVAGWREASRTGLVFTPVEGNLRLPPLAGRASRTRIGGHPGVACVKALATDDCGDLYVLDAGKNLIRRRRAPNHAAEIEGCPATPLERIPSIGDGKGEPGSGPRRLNQPRSIVPGPRGTLLVADTGNNRIQVFETATWSLADVWTGFDRPWGIAYDATRNRIYVAESGANCISVLNSSGVLQTRYTGPLFEGTRQLALSRAGALAAISSAGLIAIDTAGHASLLAGTADTFSAVAFDRLGRLHAGTTEGVIYQFAAESADEALVPLGVSFSGVSGRIDAIADWPPPQNDDPIRLLLAIVRENDRRTTFWTAAVGDACGTDGSFVSQTLNSGIEQCSWHRLVLRGKIPEGSSVSIFTQTASAGSAFPEFAKEAQFRAVGPATDIDCLVQSLPGQCLRFRLDFQSSGLRSPELNAIDAEFPRKSYLRFLPSIYQDDPESRSFLDRFLSLFQTLIDEENQTVDDVYRLFDPLTVPEAFLPWLAEWLAFPLDPSWDLRYKRAMLARAFGYYQIRGTKAGVEQAVRDFANVAFTAVVEHFQLRKIPDLCCGASLEDGLPLWSPRIYSRWQVGAYSTVGELHLIDEPEPVAEPFAIDAHRFSVFFPADPIEPAAVAKRVARVVAAEKPAHTEAILCAVYPRFRVGVQSRVGVDSMVGAAGFMMLSGNGQARVSRLGYDTILNPSMAHARLQDRGNDVTPAVGGTTRLL